MNGLTKLRAVAVRAEADSITGALMACAAHAPTPMENAKDRIIAAATRLSSSLALRQAARWGDALREAQAAHALAASVVALNGVDAGTVGVGRSLMIGADYEISLVRAHRTKPPAAR